MPVYMPVVIYLYVGISVFVCACACASVCLMPSLDLPFNARVAIRKRAVLACKIEVMQRQTNQTKSNNDWYVSGECLVKWVYCVVRVANLQLVALWIFVVLVQPPTGVMGFSASPCGV